MAMFCFAFTTLPMLSGSFESNALPKNITLKASASGQHGAYLSWNKIKSPNSGYAVFRDGQAIAHLSKSKKAYTDSGLSSGSAHTYQIKTYTKKTKKQWYNKKTKKWQSKKPAKKYRGGSRKVTSYSYKKKSNSVSIRTAYAYFTITFKNWNGAVLKTQTYVQGSTPSCAAPTRPADANNTYTFAGWSPSITTAWSNRTYTAQFKAVPIANYTITWKNWDGKVLATTTAKKGETPSYNGATPTKAADSNNTYTFSGWSPQVAPTSGNATYTAQFESTAVPSYTITWKNWNGTSLGTSNVKKGEVPVYNGTTPKRTADDNYVYSFKGWTPELKAATENATYTAQFTAIPKYTVIWKNWDGTVLDTLTVREGTKPVYTKGTPTRPTDDNYVYTFSGWDPPMQAVQANTTYVAQYTAEEKIPDAKYYTVTWKNGDTVLGEQSVMEGETPQYSGSTPTKPATTEYTYTFSGWSPEVSAVTADVTYQAQFRETRRTYTITWVVDGKSSTTTVNAGDVPVYNGTPTKPTANGKSYTFTGWSPTPVAATGNKTYTAQFSETSVSPLGYTYKIHLLTEPYGNAGTERMLIPVYLETDNPNYLSYDFSIKDNNGKDVKFSTVYTYYKRGNNTSKHLDFSIDSIPTGCVYLGYTDYSGKATIDVYEYDNDGNENIVSTKQITIKDYNAEEQAWIQSVINNATDSSMTNSDKMFAICKYLGEDLNLQYTKVDKDNPDNGYLSILADEGKPYWVTRRANSYISPTFLVKFGTALGYPLHNCYYDYEEGSDMWRAFHTYAYSEADDLYFSACPGISSGYTDLTTIEQINLKNYQFWGE